jgi:hypothetical protein
MNHESVSGLCFFVNTVFARVSAALFDKNLPSKIGVRQIHGMLKKFLNLREKVVII